MSASFGIDATSIEVQTEAGNRIKTVTVHPTRCPNGLGFRVSCPSSSSSTSGAGSAKAEGGDTKAAPIAWSMLAAGAVALGGFAFRNRHAGRHL